jgi:hypothetical protein
VATAIDLRGELVDCLDCVGADYARERGTIGRGDRRALPRVRVDVITQLGPVERASLEDPAVLPGVAYNFCIRLELVEHGSRPRVLDRAPVRVVLRKR